MQFNNGFKLDLPSEYKIIELIFINSGSNYYVKLPVDNNAALYSGNNQGKTSTLAALKLFLLPEVNFKKSADKFGFASGGEYFSDIDSFQYYFPSSESYIICNSENPAWRDGFCWVLFRTTDYGYHRIAVPHPYSYIEHLFWDGSSKLNNGIGQLRIDINLTEIKKKLTSKEYGGELFTDRTLIGEAIYSRTSTTDDHTRFSLLPMSKRFTAASVDTVRALLGMAFSLGNASTSTLPMAIGSIIDGMGLSVVKDDGVFIDLDSALDEWQRLKKEDERLSLIEELQPKWKELKLDNSIYNSLKLDINKKYQTIFSAVYNKREELNAKLKSLIEELTIAEKNYNLSNKSSINAEDKLKTVLAQHDAQKKMIHNLEIQLKQIEEIRLYYGPLCQSESRNDEELLNVILEEIKFIDQEIKALENEGVAQNKLIKVLSDIKESQDELLTLKRNIIELDNGQSFFDNLEQHSRSVLSSLNSGFAQINYKPTEQEKNIICSFTGMFSCVDECLCFNGVKIPSAKFKEHDLEMVKNKVKDKIENIKRQLILYNKEKSSLLESLKMKPEARVSKLHESKCELDKVTKKKNIFEGRSILADNLREAECELIEIKKQEEIFKENHEKSIETLKESNKKYKDTLFRQNEIQKPLERLDSQYKEIDELLYKHQGVIVKYNENDAIQSSIEYEESIIRDEMLLLSNKLKEVDSIRERVLERFRYLLGKNIIHSSPEDIYSINTTRKIFQDYFDSFETLFSTLERSRNRYIEQLNAHNNTAETSAKIIENIKGVIESFIYEINQQLNGYHISNLDGFEITADLHPLYVEVVESMNKVSSHLNSLLPEDFYKQVQNFQSKFYIRKTGKIDLSKIIEKVSYQFNRNGKKEAVPQSNGTNCMVNAVLLALLLKRLVPEDLELSIPVIFDEVGSLDERNLYEILSVVEEHGLTLFAANPEATGVIASVLDTYHDLSSFQVSDVEVHGKAEWIYFSGMEETLFNVKNHNDLSSQISIEGR
ncbi:hypothetical protein [uncultured Tolumonas sp.]|uniref:hypothetical protein n=1 Tax=uncultured Tolumonas sp. TaxID=263765 RepID=UPI002A0A6987|nr:hypothetical protein [uncultured Tolumonas sp.]